MKTLFYLSLLCFWPDCLNAKLDWRQISSTSDYEMAAQEYAKSSDAERKLFIDSLNSHFETVLKRRDTSLDRHVFNFENLTRKEKFEIQKNLNEQHQIAGECNQLGDFLYKINDTQATLNVLKPIFKNMGDLDLGRNLDALVKCDNEEALTLLQSKAINEIFKIKNNLDHQGIIENGIQIVGNCVDSILKFSFPAKNTAALEIKSLVNKELSPFFVSHKRIAQLSEDMEYLVPSPKTPNIEIPKDKTPTPTTTKPPAPSSAQTSPDAAEKSNLIIYLLLSFVLFILFVIIKINKNKNQPN